MNRFPKYKGQDEEHKLEVVAEHKCTLKHGYRKAKSAMFKDDMLPLLKTRETSSLPSLLSFNESNKVNSVPSSFFNKLEEMVK